MSYRCIPAGYEDEDEVDAYSDMMQKITIVPDITTGAGLNGEDFDSRLSADVDNWFESYRDRWNSYKRTPTAQQSLKLLLMQQPDPLLLALKLFANCPGCNNLKNKNLALFILETTCDLYKQHPDIASRCDDNTRMIAFNFVKTSGVTPLYKAVMATYELHKIRDLLVPKIRELIAKGFFKDAACWTMHLQMTQLFGIYDIVFPLILQDKVNLAEEYLSVAKEQILPTVQFLDSLLDKQKTVMELCDDILTKYKYVDIKHNYLSYRPMSKLVTRLVKKFKIDAHLTPNLNFTKACSYMNYLWHKYRDGGMSSDSWRELIHDSASTHALQVVLITNIASYGDYDEAVYWLNHFNMPLNDLAPDVGRKLKRHIQTNEQLETSFKSEKSDSSTEGATATAAAAGKSKRSNSLITRRYLTLDLPATSIILVDVKERFVEMLSYLEGHHLIAFDSEWKPSVCNDNVVSLLQLATTERVYLLDCLSPNLSDDMWQQLGRKIFNNLEVLKIGFSLHQDLRMLHKSLPLHLNMQATSCYLDLCEMWRRLKYVQTVTFPYGNGTSGGESLSALTEVCLGKTLDKSNQFSNWANRPLRHDQIVYAALDAHCLLQVYQVFAEIVLRMGLDIDQVVDEITTSKPSSLFRLKQSKSEQSFKESLDKSIVSMQGTFTNGANSASSIKFICDSMLLGLSIELRKLGIDCVNVLKYNTNYYIDLARRENRYVLTRDARYALFTGELPQAQCIQIPTHRSVEQVLNVISLLDIQISERNLFTRCVQCNGNEFILIMKQQMQQMRFGNAPLPAKSNENSTTFMPDKTFQILYANDHIINTKTTYRGKPIKLNRIQPQIVHVKEHFFICDNCGLCSWDGAYSVHSSIMNIITTGTRPNAVAANTNATQ